MEDHAYLAYAHTMGPEMIEDEPLEVRVVGEIGRHEDHDGRERGSRLLRLQERVAGGFD